MAEIKDGLYESANLQVVTAKDLKDLLKSFTDEIRQIIKRSIQDFKLGNKNDLLAGKEEESNQDNVTLKDKRDTVGIKMEVITLETEVLEEASIQLIEKQQEDSLLQVDKYFDKFWLYRQNQYLRNELIDYKRRRSRNGGFNLKEITPRRERIPKTHQLQFQTKKFLKIKAGGEVMLKKKVLLVKDWKKYRKKERLVV